MPPQLPPSLPSRSGCLLKIQEHRVGHLRSACLQVFRLRGLDTKRSHARFMPARPAPLGDGRLRGPRLGAGQPAPAAQVVEIRHRDRRPAAQTPPCRRPCARARGCAAWPARSRSRGLHRSAPADRHRPACRAQQSGGLSIVGLSAPVATKRATSRGTCALLRLGAERSRCRSPQRLRRWFSRPVNSGRETGSCLSPFIGPPNLSGQTCARPAPFSYQSCSPHPANRCRCAQAEKSAWA